MSVNSKMTAIANAIRNLKSIAGRTLTLDDMASEISAIGKYAGTQASGVKSITANGTYDVTQFASAAVNVPVGAVHVKRIEVTVPNDVTSFSHNALAVDSDIAAHYSDINFYGALIANDGFNSKTSIQAVLHGNKQREVYFGSVLRSSASSVGAAGIRFPISAEPTTSNIGGLFANSNGEIGYTVTSSYPLRAGSYTILVFW